ncbi:MAG: primosomal protein N' [Rickettsiaceae bacterium]|nr:MAG: primosomal protein N' [Rickettsiaceae bacterium]
MQIIKVLLPVAQLFPLIYQVPTEMCVKLGDMVIVKFRNKKVNGIVYEVDVTSDKILKYIETYSSLNFKICSNLIKLINKTASYYMYELGTVAKLVLPVEILSASTKTMQQTIPATFSLSLLSQTQEKILNHIINSNKPCVIKGITGSGKTEIYFHLVADYLKQGKQVLILLPEIGLSHQIIKRFISKFGFQPAIWNSTVTVSQKKIILRSIIVGDVKVVIGTRSSLFLPYKNLGIIIIDEEHDSSYKQEEGVTYNARDMAVMRSHIENIKIVLCSATPSLETIHNCRLDKYKMIELPDRYNGALKPIVNIINMRNEKLSSNSWLSSLLIESIKSTLAKKEQVLLFLNRRGYSPLILCRKCGYRFTCPSCSSWLVLHKSPPRLECHHCGHQTQSQDNCPECKDTNSLISCGPGIERIAEEVSLHFPDQVVAMFSKDQIMNNKDSKDILNKIENNQIDILIGTQITTKGYHFPNLTLVGVIDADLGLTGDDLRSSERTYQLLHQVGGRAGREQKVGQVFFQTYYPDNVILKYLKEDQENNFIDYELSIRRDSNMPPYTRMASITMSSCNEDLVSQLAKKLKNIAPKCEVRILGPARATIFKLSGRYRYRILVISNKHFNLQKYLHYWISMIHVPSSIRLKIDIDPQSFY